MVLTFQCLLIPVLPGNPDPSIGSLVPIDNDYRQGKPSMSISNTFQVISEDGGSVVTAFLNATQSYEPSWIIRQELADSSSLKMTGVAFDHRLARLKAPFNASENVYGFQHKGFAYFLRYAYRARHIRDGPTFEWVWQLTRVCLNDPSKELRSRVSIPLNCTFSINSAEEGLGWRPTSGYFDETDENLYIYAQPNLSSRDREFLKDIRHRICSFDMKTIAQEFERTFKRCYQEYSHLVAAHSSQNTATTLTCKDYQMVSRACLAILGMTHRLPPVFQRRVKVKVQILCHDAAAFIGH